MPIGRPISWVRGQSPRRCKSFRRARRHRPWTPPPQSKGAFNHDDRPFRVLRLHGWPRRQTHCREPKPASWSSPHGAEPRAWQARWTTADETSICFWYGNLRSISQVVVSFTISNKSGV